MLQTLTLGYNPLTLTPIYRTHIHLHWTHPHNTSFLFYFLPSLQTQIICHICFSILCLLHNMSSSSTKWLVHYDGAIIKIDKGNTFHSPNLLFFETKWSFTLEALKTKIHHCLCLQQLDQVRNISFCYPQVMGGEMLKFIIFQLVDNEYVKDMISVIHQTEILQCWELYAKHQARYNSHPKP